MLVNPTEREFVMQSFVIRNVGIQRGLGLKTEPPMDVYIAEGKIQRIASSNSLPIHQNEVTIDGTNKFIMPGLIFAHTHIAYDNVCGAKDVLFKHPLIRLAYIAASVAKRAAQLGYTTMVGAGSISRLDVYLKEAIGSGLFDGPQIIACSRDIMAAGPLGKRSKEKVAHIPADYMPVLTELDEIDAAVNREIDDGAEILKTFATGDDQFPNANSQDELFDFEELLRMVQIARQRNVLIRCHARGLSGIKNAIKAEVDIIDHATYADQESLDKILANNISIVPSYYQPKQYLANGHKYGKHPEESNFYLEVENTTKFLPIAENMGINIAIGDDFGFAWTPHGTYHEELISYQKQLSIPAEIIIKWATFNGAKMIKAENRIGSLEEGKQADIILLSADPAIDISVLSTNIEQVFISGKAVNMQS